MKAKLAVAAIGYSLFSWKASVQTASLPTLLLVGVCYGVMHFVRICNQVKELLPAVPDVPDELLLPVRQEQDRVDRGSERGSRQGRS